MFPLICYLLKSPPKFSSLKNNNDHYLLRFLWVRTLRVAWLGSSGLVAVRCWLDLQLSEGWAGAPAAKGVHSQGGRCGFLVAFPLGCLLSVYKCLICVWFHFVLSGSQSHLEPYSKLGPLWTTPFKH